jgi:hypothetical protein
MVFNFLDFQGFKGRCNSASACLQSGHKAKQKQLVVYNFDEMGRWIIRSVQIKPASLSANNPFNLSTPSTFSLQSDFFVLS